MTDKCFGDHMNRNIVKNPLLSTAVTGLSIEDLTHNAVLLPVSLSQEVITRPDHQTNTQTQTLAHADHGNSNFPSGDANSNIYSFNLPPTTPKPTPSFQKPLKTEMQVVNAKSTVSKATVKSEDDFDVNEYFARLQGTRYVSAPLSSGIKEDSNANLDATEENLEEINLNEPEKPPYEVQQSITADVVQNFSQLPTVLPQMASAVFSSFSNMLQTKKSREPTPESVKAGGYQEVQFERPSGTVTDFAGESVPPPKEPPMLPPTVGTGNYRLLTKKKYAQIPGLTSGDSAQTPYQPFNQNVKINQNIPQYFVPNPNNNNAQNQPGPHETKTIESQTFENKSDANSYFDNKTEFMKNYDSTSGDGFGQNVPDQKESITQSEISMFPDQSNQFFNQDVSNQIHLATTVLPPPPMFSNARKDSQSNVIKSVLPPSVARRISSNQPILKQSPQVSALPDNMLIPSPVTDAVDNITLQNSQSSQAFTQPDIQSAFASFNPQISTTISSLPQSSGPPLPPKSVQITPPIVDRSNRPTLDPIPPPISFTPNLSKPSQLIAPPVMFTPQSLSSGAMAINPPSITPPPSYAQATQPPYDIFTPPPSNNQTQAPPPLRIPAAAPPFFNPCSITHAETKEFPPIANKNPTPVENEPKPVPEPPKAIGNVNYRMTKKRPQYYSGPIEGIGAISNNVKPVIPPVNASLFQGAMFTPQVVGQSSTNVDQTVPFDINRPIETFAPQPNPQVENYNTVFDVSRPTTESYSEPKQEGGFGLLGSLKSKLTSLDINKIQNSVTTFFDPGYNESKKDNSSVQENVTYGQQSSFEIYVPNAVAPQTDNYQSSQIYCQESQRCYQSQDAYSCDQNPGQNITHYYDGNAPSNIHTAQNLQGDVQAYYDKMNVQAEQQTPTLNPVALQTTASAPSHSYSIPSQLASNQTEEIQINRVADVQSDGNLQGSYSTVPPYLPPTNTQSNIANTSTSVSIQQQNISQIGQEDASKNFFENSQGNVFETLQIDTNDKANDGSTNKSEDDAGNNNDLLAKSVPDSQPITQKQTDLQKPVTTTNQFEGLELGPPKSFFDSPQLNVSQSSPNTATKPQDFYTPVQNMLEANTSAAASFFDSPQLQLRSDYTQLLKSEIEDKVSEAIGKDDMQNILLKLQGNSADFFGSFSQGDATPQSFFSKYTFDADSRTTTEQVVTERHTEPEEDEEQIDVSSVPLAGLSTMLANKTRELTYLENEMNHMTMHEPPKDSSQNKTTNIIFFDNAENVQPIDDSDLNICETCREVNKPEDRDDREDDLTQQLIENITSPIQLSNPVEVPLTESNTPVDDVTDFEANQFAEISHITEETIETIQVQSAAELLEDGDVENINIRHYGWSEDASPVPKDLKDHKNSRTSNQPNETELNLPIDPNIIGFYGNNALFSRITANVDETKTDFESTNASVVLPRQMSLPTAPPEEEETKSEALDVHSIEQDASKDFPIFEEFVIEPAEVDDDDKIELSDRVKSSEKIAEDTFTSRIDKYKKNEETDTFDKSSPIFGKLTTSPSIPMASYFDTGNYAVETHYRNSLTSPTTVSLFPQISVPPGFEEEYKRRLSFNTKDKDGNIAPAIPETSTQTHSTFSPTSSMVGNVQVVTTSSDMPRMSNFEQKEMKLPEFDIFFGRKDHLKQEFVAQNIFSPDINYGIEKQVNTKVVNQVLDQKQGDFTGFFADDQKISPEPILKQAEFTGIFGASNETKPATNIFEKPTSSLTNAPKPVPLPDHINFFGSSSETVQKTDVGDNSFNRLASYFSSPPKTDNSKSFFELSQGQDHYRQDSIPKPEPTPQPTNIHNIPKDEYLANIKLMNDLTSINNAEFKPETTVRTVNYFTIEYDNKTLNQFGTDIKKVELEGTVDNNVSSGEPKVDIEESKDVIDCIFRCKYCCNDKVMNKKCDNISHDVLTYNVRTCMDNTTEDKRKEIAMDPITNEEGRSVANNVGGEATADSSGAVLDSTVENRANTEYGPVKHHWFYSIDVEGKTMWRGFSAIDSKALERAFLSPDLTDDTLVPTDGGRFDVNVKGRLRFPVYWADNPSNVRRCSWFYKGPTDPRYGPYTEALAERLEEEYRHGILTGEWHRRLSLPNNEMVVMHGPGVMVHFLQANASDAFSSAPLLSQAFGKRVYRNPPKIKVARDQPKQIDHLVMMVHGAGEYRHQQDRIQSSMRPRVVRRGYDESEIEEMEPTNIDHLLLFCHGVGSACDMRFRNVEEVVDDFRTASLQLIQSHYKNSFESGEVGRVEVLPVSWHATLHSGETGVDRRLARITLDSIPRLRSFTNDTVLDVLFYTSPVFCQTIINTVCAELNRIYNLFKQRNPDFNGGVSLGGHSLGSVILYDLLSHQAPPKSPSAKHNQEKRYVSGVAGTGQPFVNYPALNFNPVALYALGSPIAIFECIRGVDCLGTEFSLPTCKNFFNIFHPYDPIAYRIEPLIHPDLKNVKPQLIPHHKGRKRMHLELKDTMARVGADIKQKLIESIRSTWTSMWKSQPPPTDRLLEKVVEEEMEKENLTTEKEDTDSDEASPEMLGELNAGRRVDYVLQEAPLEMINEYLFAMRSHVCYWESEDTMLLMLREIYDALGVPPDSTVPQQTMTVQRTRLAKQDETSATVENLADHPSTSRGESL